MSDKKHQDAGSQTEVAALNESGGVNRRRFVQGAAGLGLTASALGGMFSDYIAGDVISTVMPVSSSSCGS